MKFVKEALEDILKPKSEEEIGDARKEIEEKIEGFLEWGKDEIIFIEGLNKDTDRKIRKEANDMRAQARGRVTEFYYSLPGFFQNKYYKELSELESKLGDLVLDESFIPLFESKKIKNSAGFFIIQDDKVLLEHPTGNSWYGTFSIPKGHIKKGEDALFAAIRETKEEIGISINIDDVHSGPHVVDYTKNSRNIRRNLSPDSNNLLGSLYYKTKLYKKVYYYIVIPSIPILDKDLVLQKSEVDWAGFLSKSEAKIKIFWRFQKALSDSFDFVEQYYANQLK